MIIVQSKGASLDLDKLYQVTYAGTDPEASFIEANSAKTSSETKATRQSDTQPGTKHPR